jgi:hypothetical protein
MGKSTFNDYSRSIQRILLVLGIISGIKANENGVHEFNDTILNTNLEILFLDNLNR